MKSTSIFKENLARHNADIKSSQNLHKNVPKTKNLLIIQRDLGKIHDIILRNLYCLKVCAENVGLCTIRRIFKAIDDDK